jgi:phage gpG-like protein
MSATPDFIHLTFRGLREAVKYVEDYPKRVQRALKDPATLREVGQVLVSDSVRHFGEGGKPKWAPLKASTIAAKLKRYKKASAPMVATGQLRQSLDYDVKSGALYLTSAAHLKYHQWPDGRSGKLPMRPVLPNDLSQWPETEQEVKEIVIERLPK